MPELARLARVTPKVMRLMLRKVGFPAPGRRGSTERIRFSELRSRDPGLVDSLIEASAVRARLGDG